MLNVSKPHKQIVYRAAEQQRLKKKIAFEENTLYIAENDINKTSVLSRVK